MNGQEKVLDLIDAGRFRNSRRQVLENIFRKGKKRTRFHSRSQRVCSVVRRSDLHLITEQSQDITSPDPAKLDGSEAVFLSCLEMALTTA